MLFILNIIGLGMGPQATGVLSDLLRESAGTESMRYALLCAVSFAYPLAALSFFIAGRTIERDLERAGE
jgi:hypothetical protein